jgi:hypothetical protein
MDQKADSATDKIMAMADKYWEASTAARYRVRDELEQAVRDAVGMSGMYDHLPPCFACNGTGRDLSVNHAPKDDAQEVPRV